MLNCNKAERLKDQFFSEHFITALGKSISNQFKDFNKEDFNQQIYTPAWKYLELKAKRRHVTEALTSVLPDDYPEALEILLKAAPGFTGFNDMVFGFGDTENTEVNELFFDPAELNIGEKGVPFIQDRPAK